jgi:hypothetical protein
MAKVTKMDDPGAQESGDEEEFVDDANDDANDDSNDDANYDDQVSARDQLLLDRKELHEAGLDLDNPEGFADE